MSFDYPTVSITGTSEPYSVYVDQTSADTYVAASIVSAADTWRDSTSTSADTKARALVSATRWLDSVNWLGAQTDSTQGLQWPRANITDVDSTSLPSQLQAACIELALSLVDNQDARSDLSGPLAKELRAGSVGIQYFRPESDTQVQTPFPANVMSLISQWLGGSSGNVAGGPCSYGTEGRSRILDQKYDYEHGI
jgi:hypothetical protein